MKEYANQLLLQMFSDYVGSGYKRMHVINEPEGNYNFTAQDVVKYMENMGYIKHPLYKLNNISCMIELGGIEEADPTYFENHIMTVLECMYTTNTRQNINVVLQFPKEHLERSMDVGALMQRRNLIQAVQTTGAGHVAEISPQGRVYYEENQARFLN